MKRLMHLSFQYLDTYAQREFIEVYCVDKTFSILYMKHKWADRVLRNFIRTMSYVVKSKQDVLLKILRKSDSKVAILNIKLMNVKEIYEHISSSDTTTYYYTEQRLCGLL